MKLNLGKKVCLFELGLTVSQNASLKPDLRFWTWYEADIVLTTQDGFLLMSVKFKFGGTPN